MLQGREVFFFESFFRLIFEFLTNSVLQCIVKKGGPLNLYIYKIYIYIYKKFYIYIYMYMGDL